MEATAPPPTKAAPFDFDSAFTGVGSAPVEDDDEDDEGEEADVFSPARNTTDFDPTFDSSPQLGASNLPHQTAYSSVTNGTPNPPAEDFFAANGPAPPTSDEPAPSTTSPVSHDWDALFAPLGSNTATPHALAPVPVAKDDTTSQAPMGPRPPRDAEPADASPAPAGKALHPAQRPQRPQPGRALSTGTEHDDPILKRLTAMGWSRDESLAALEKFDYNIDKVST
jgi:epidermal growth factor receptor substrate 15